MITFNILCYEYAYYAHRLVLRGYNFIVNSYTEPIRRRVQSRRESRLEMAARERSPEITEMSSPRADSLNKDVSTSSGTTILAISYELAV